MEIFNNTFSEIDYYGLVVNLKNSTMYDESSENSIIDAIWNSQIEISKLLDVAEAYVENVRKYSNRNIYIKRWQLITTGDDPTIYANSVSLIGYNSDSISGLLNKASISGVMDDFFWKLGDTVYITNAINNKDTIPSTDQLIPTEEMLTYYFLERKDGERLYKCTVDDLPTTIPLSIARDDTVLSRKDIDRYFFLIDEKIGITGKTIDTSQYLISQTNAYIPSAMPYFGTSAERIYASNGGVTLIESIEKYFRIDSPELSRDAELPYGAATNTAKTSEIYDIADKTKAPFSGWKTLGLKKGDLKDDSFFDSFVAMLLGGESVPDDSIDDFMSLVSKKEIDIILDKIRNEIGDIEVCDDIDLGDSQ